jgi:hypothetical protein
MLQAIANLEGCWACLGTLFYTRPVTQLSLILARLEPMHLQYKRSPDIGR